MPTLTDEEMFYSAESRDVIRLIKNRIEDMLVELALKRAKAEGRAVVTGADVMATFEDQFSGKFPEEIRDAG